ncbi:MAG: hypothetical protein WD824_02855 [Cyclobacteriaceae bacterium]
MKISIKPDPIVSTLQKNTKPITLFKDKRDGLPISNIIIHLNNTKES